MKALRFLIALPLILALTGVSSGPARAAGATITTFYTTSKAALDAWDASTASTGPSLTSAFPSGTVTIVGYFEYSGATPGSTRVDVTVARQLDGFTQSLGEALPYTDGWTAVLFSPDAGPFPDGTYHADLLLDGSVAASTTFTVGNASSSSPPTLTPTNTATETPTSTSTPAPSPTKTPTLRPAPSKTPAPRPTPRPITQNRMAAVRVEHPGAKPDWSYKRRSLTNLRRGERVQLAIYVEWRRIEVDNTHRLKLTFQIKDARKKVVYSDPFTVPMFAACGDPLASSCVLRGKTEWSAKTTLPQSGAPGMWVFEGQVSSGSWSSSASVRLTVR